MRFFNGFKLFLILSILILNCNQSFAYNDEPDKQASDLIKEYKENLYFINIGSKNKTHFLTRNKQIDSILAGKAFQQYIDSFDLIATPIAKTLIEEKKYQPKIIDSDFDYVAKRYRIRYELEFSSDSPKPIKNFNVLINGKKPEIKNGKVFFEYDQKWDEEDTIEVRVQEKNNPKSIFYLDRNLKKIESEDSGKINPNAIEEKIQSNQKEFEDREKEKKEEKENEKQRNYTLILLNGAIFSFFAVMFFL